MERVPTQYETKDIIATTASDGASATTAITTATTSSTDNDCPRFRPFASLPSMKLKVRKAKYSTSLDPRGYIPVYEYIINNQPIMWDRETGYVHFTGIWKALGNSKSDIVKMVDSNPELKVKKIRGGFLKIQGTWIPYEFAVILCRRTSWYIRKELTAIFG
ncbi:transcription regulator HTH, apses-type DNA-binding domain-containing protein, partial [Chlamydoabsidia padenii]